MSEIDALIHIILHTPPATYTTYEAIFQKHFAINPHTISTHQLQSLVQENGYAHADTLSHTDCLHYLMSHTIEPTLGQKAPIFITDYPATQAALAKLNKDTPHIAERFELYIQGQ